MIHVWITKFVKLPKDTMGSFIMTFNTDVVAKQVGMEEANAIGWRQQDQTQKKCQQPQPSEPSSPSSYLSSVSAGPSSGPDSTISQAGTVLVPFSVNSLDAELGLISDGDPEAMFCFFKLTGYRNRCTSKAFRAKTAANLRGKGEKKASTIEPKIELQAELSGRQGIPASPLNRFSCLKAKAPLLSP